MPADLDALEALLRQIGDDERSERHNFAHAGRVAFMDAAPSLIAELRALREANRWRPIAEAHEDLGTLVLINIHDAGDLRLAHVCDYSPVSWEEASEGMTHFSQIAPLTNEQAEALIAAIPDPPEGA